jgi:hypothetical protein
MHGVFDVLSSSERSCGSPKRWTAPSAGSDGAFRFRQSAAANVDALAWVRDFIGRFCTRCVAVREVVAAATPGAQLLCVLGLLSGGAGLLDASLLDAGLLSGGAGSTPAMTAVGAAMTLCAAGLLFLLPKRGRGGGSGAAAGTGATKAGPGRGAAEAGPGTGAAADAFVSFRVAFLALRRTIDRAGEEEQCAGCSDASSLARIGEVEAAAAAAAAGAAALLPKFRGTSEE